MSRENHKRWQIYKVCLSSLYILYCVDCRPIPSYWHPVGIEDRRLADRLLRDTRSRRMSSTVRLNHRCRGNVCPTAQQLATPPSNTRPYIRHVYCIRIAYNMRISKSNSQINGCMHSAQKIGKNFATRSSTTRRDSFHLLSITRIPTRSFLFFVFLLGWYALKRFSSESHSISCRKNVATSLPLLNDNENLIYGVSPRFALLSKTKF